MKILILEDNPQRHIQFEEDLKNHDICIVDVVDTTISLLKNEKWDALFLDHDLGGHVRVEPGTEPTGYDVAVFLEENKHLQPPLMVIHSHNTVGAERMKAALPNARIIPFSSNMNLN